MWFNTPITSYNDYNKYLTIRDCGVYLINTASGGNSTSLPLFYSMPDLSNRTYQPTITGSISTATGVNGVSGVGNYSSHSAANIDNLYLVYPKYGVICYPNTGWSGTPILLNYQNFTNNPVIVAPTGIDNTQSVKIYYNDVEQVKL